VQADADDPDHDHEKADDEYPAFELAENAIQRHQEAHQHDQQQHRVFAFQCVRFQPQRIDQSRRPEHQPHVGDIRTDRIAHGQPGVALQRRDRRHH